MRKSFPAAIGAVSLAIVLGGCGTTPYDVMKNERQHAESEQACTAAGFRPGTNQFAICMQDRNALVHMPVTSSDIVSPR